MSSSSMINFGIDLGTSNSLVAHFDKGQVEVFKNPSGFKETLPSVVGFRNDRVLVGDQAKVFAGRDPKSVVSRFKRKMGTSESFKIKSLSLSKTPVELSAYVLKELKTFLRDGLLMDSAVITIPASFDTVQSNATKEAGIQAGFKSVVLLQEPIAASLAYANKGNSEDLRNSQWLVYDLGGGTFDVALVKIVEGELNVVDHEGDNFLGGTDFDALIVEKLVVPELEKRGKFANLLAEMQSESGRYNALWNSLLARAEEAKVELSSKSSAEIDLGTIQNLSDDDGNPIDSIINITRSQFEALILEPIDRTVTMMKQILTRNSLQPVDLKFILMVGGSTYIPLVRRRVEELMGIRIDTGIDPTNAIAVGAAFFAGSKEKDKGEQPAAPAVAASGLKIKVSYNRSSQEKEETFAARVDGAAAGMQYRITNQDGSFDSGAKALTGRIMEDLPLREGAYNIFTFKVIDAQGNPVPTDVETIQIAHGRYSVAGQMLPEDISLVKDDVAAKDTTLALIFGKNAVLPTKAKKTVEVGRTVIKGSDEGIQIMLVEGPSNRHSSTNKPIGLLSITGKQISKDLLRGTEVDLSFAMSESRDLTVSAYLNGTGQEFSQVFVPKERTVSSQMLAHEIVSLEDRVQAELEEAEKVKNPTLVGGLRGLLSEVQTLMEDGQMLGDDDVTDKKFQLEDRKRVIAQQVFELTSAKRLAQAKSEYARTKSEVAGLVKESGNDRERTMLSEVLGREPIFISSQAPEKFVEARMVLDAIRWTILQRTPDFLCEMFKHLVTVRASLNDQVQAKQLFENGKRAIDNSHWDDLREINHRLWDLVPAATQNSEELRVYTGIV